MISIIFHPSLALKLNWTIRRQIFNTFYLTQNASKMHQSKFTSFALIIISSFWTHNMLWLYDLSYSPGWPQAAVDWCSCSGPQFLCRQRRGEIWNIPRYLMQTQWKISGVTLQGVLLLDGRPAIRVHKGSLTPRERTGGEAAYLGT